MLTMVMHLFGDQTRGMVELAWTDPGQGAPRHAQLFQLDQLDELVEKAAELNAAKRSIYIGGSLRQEGTPPFGRTSTEDFFAATASWSDHDEEGGAVRAAAICRQLGARPTFVVFTGHQPHDRCQLWWRLDEPLQDAAQVKLLLGQIQARLDSDAAVVDPIRIMRLAGSIAWPTKSGRVPELTEGQLINGADVYGLERLKAIFGSAEDKPSNGGASFDDFFGADVEALLAAIRAGDHWHDNMVRLVGHWIMRGLSDVEILTMAEALTLPGYTVDQTRYEVAVMIRGGREKWNKPNPIHTTADTAPVAYTLLRDLKPNLISNDIVRDLLPKHAFGEVHADAGGGKTAIVVDLLLHVAAGLEYRGRRTEQQVVVYVALEGHGGIDNRVIAAAKELGIADAPFALVKSSASFRDAATGEKVAAIVKELTEQYGGDCPIVAIDTYTAALGAGGSDCDPATVSAFINTVQMHLLTKCTVLILHHFGKDQSRGGRGWSGLRASLDFEIEIDRDEDLRILRVTKSRDGSDQQPACCYRLHGRILGQNNYSEDVTAVVVEHLADEEIARRGKRFSSIAHATLNVLWEMIKDREQSHPMPDDPGLRCVILADWEKACAGPGVISTCQRERDRIRKFRAAKEELEAARAIICDGEGGNRVYPAPKGGATGATGRDEK
jgi:AAA domain